MPAAIPKKSNPKRILQRLLLKETPINAMPTAMEERMIAFLCVIREDKNPDPRIPMKYPVVVRRKSDPASP